MEDMCFYFFLIPRDKEKGKQNLNTKRQGESEKKEHDRLFFVLPMNLLKCDFIFCPKVGTKSK